MSEIDEEYDIIIDPAANDRMDEHFEFLARVSESAAERLLERLIEDINSLKQMPFRCPVYDRPYLPKGKYRYMISESRYRIVYQIEGNIVFIDDIQDCRQSDRINLL